MQSDQNSNDEDGLSAFDNLEPVSTVSEVNLVPEVRPSLRSPSMPPSMPQRQSLGGSSPSLPPPIPAPSAPSFPPPPPHAAATIPSMPPPPPSIPPVVSPQEDYGFDDEEESTQFYERGDSAPAAGAASLNMDWGEDEPETRLRDELPAFEGGDPSPFDDLPPMEGGFPSPFPPAPSSMSPHGAVHTSTEEWPSERPVGRKRTMVALGMVAVAAVALGAVWKFGKSKPAVAMLVTEPADADVMVDGMKLASSHSPFILELTPDEQHEVVVSKEGFETQKLPISLESGERLDLPAVELVSTKVEAGFALSSEPSGARVLIDGVDTGKTTPVRLTDMKEGMHTVRLEADKGAQTEVQVYVVAGKVLELPTATLSKPVAAKPVREEKPEEAESSSSKAPAKRAAHRRSSSKRGRLAAVARPSKPAASSGTGVLRLNSLPWSQVTVDGRAVGNTPLMNLPLPAGKHSIRMFNPDMGLTKTIKVTLKAGSTTTKVVNMAQ